MDVTLVALGGPAGVNITFWRRTWEVVEADPRRQRYMVAPVTGSRRIVVAQPLEFVTVVMRGPRADYRLTASWNGRNAWAEQDGRGGVYMQPFKGSEKFRPLVVPSEAFLAKLGVEVDLAEFVGRASRTRVRRITIDELRRLLTAR